MPRRGDEYEDDDDQEPEEEEEEEYALDEEDEEEEYEDDGGKTKRKRGGGSQYIDSYAEEDEDEDEEEEYGGGRRGRGGKRHRKGAMDFFDEEAVVDSDEEEEEEDEPEDDFIDMGGDLPEEDDRRMHRRPLLPREDEQEDVEEMERRIAEKYAARSLNVEYDEEATDVEQQALLPSVRDPKLWMVKCAIGREREVAVCLMQKCIDRGPEMQIRSVIALDHLKNYIYIEADKEAHVREAVKGMRNIYPSKIMLVPIKEMTDVLSVESKAIDISRDTWVRMKIGIYKGDLAKVVDVDNVRQRATVKLIPRIDLQALANKLEGREVPKKKAFTPPARLMNIDEARELHIRVERRRDPSTGDYFEKIEGMMFKDGFLYKNVSLKSLSTQNVQPTFDELEKFRHSGEGGDGDMAGLSTLFANRKKGHFMKGDRVIVVKGDLRNLKGWVEKVEEDTVHIKPNEKGLPKTLAINDKELCKYFEPGNHVKVVSGASDGATGMVVSVEGHVVNIVSDTTKELLRVFADNVVESSEVTSGVTRIGDYELHDLVLLDDNSFGVIIRVESEAFQVLKGVAERPDVALVRLREIRYKIDKKLFAKDRHNNTLSVKDVVKILEGPCKGKQGPVEHIYKGILFVYDRHHLEHAGFICVKSEFCMMVGGSRANSDRNGNAMASRFSHLRTPPRVPQSTMRPPRGGPMNFGGRRGGGRGHDALVGAAVKIRLGHYKGCKGRVVDVKGATVRVELESQMKVVAGKFPFFDRSYISDNVNVTTPFRETSRYGMGSETPMHPSRTPLHPYMTPMRDSYATPHHDGMRTPMRNRAWNPYTPMSPPRDNWEDGNPASWGTSPQYQPGSSPSRAYEAPTPGSGWTNAPNNNYNDAGTPRDSGSAYANAPSPYLPSTPGGQPPMTPSSAYLPGTPGGQPMTPGSGGLDMMSPVVGKLCSYFYLVSINNLVSNYYVLKFASFAGGDNEGPWFLPEILVNVRRAGEDSSLGVIKDVLPDGSCRVGLGSSGNGEMVTVLPSEIEVVPPRKAEKIKIMGGAHRGATGKLIGIDGTDGIVKVDDTLDVKILDMVILAKLVQT
ncbi:Putative transcription elongation factor SPT5 homolog 1 [Striga hermonthica]|uniref:Transcription elongation factor SPT5 n=1 Tax=Striga hermonthica TaxID=68872 RepID=A0A9N7NKM1_STRHE|nr:Putative transcription elongation factor SPT5 homolog 1 [Striga hermonthica]